MNAGQLRTVALTLDLLDQVAGDVLRSALDGHRVNADRVTITLRLDGDMWGDREALEETLEWLDGDAMQRDLRAFADDIEAGSI